MPSLQQPGRCGRLYHRASHGNPTKLQAGYQAKGPDYKPRTEHLRPDGSPEYINRLILEDSPYLLQHAHNPVDWYPWGAEAFAKAKQEDKPVFLSIGYSTCHWCHVMERESFENPQIAKFLNEHFVSIKVDRESHPDVDQVYMTAVMLMTGRGGWPMSSFLTPAGKPFFSGTYYPPRQFASILQQIQQLWMRASGRCACDRPPGSPRLSRRATTGRARPRPWIRRSLPKPPGRCWAISMNCWAASARPPNFPTNPCSTCC